MRFLIVVGWLLTLLAQPTLSPEVLVNPPETSYLPKAIAISPSDGSIWLSVVDTKEPRWRSSVWRVDSAGKNGRVVPVGIEGVGSIERFEAPLHVTQSGDVYMVGWMKDKLHLTKIQPSGKTEFIRSISIPGLHPLGLLPGPANTWILYGDHTDGAFAARINESGKRLWLTSVKRGDLVAIFLGGEDGSSVFCGTVWDVGQGNIGIGFGTTLLVKLSSDGRMLAERSFPGRVANCTATTDGRIVSADDPSNLCVEDNARVDPNKTLTPERAKEEQRAVSSSHMRLRSWTRDLRLTWAVPASAFPPQALPMKIAPLSGGAVLLAGAGTTLLVAKYDRAEEMVWSLPDLKNGPQMFWLANSGERFVRARVSHDFDEARKKGYMRIAISQFALQ